MNENGENLIPISIDEVRQVSRALGYSSARGADVAANKLDAHVRENSIVMIPIEEWNSFRDLSGISVLNTYICRFFDY
ncbi:MAG: hypothetical protein WC906_01130 [Parcubacteria group bacterium]